MSEPQDLAYLKGFSDGWESVTKLTRHLSTMYLVAALELAVIIYLVVRVLRGETSWLRTL